MTKAPFVRLLLKALEPLARRRGSGGGLLGSGRGNIAQSHTGESSLGSGPSSSLVLALALALACPAPSSLLEHQASPPSPRYPHRDRPSSGMRTEGGRGPGLREARPGECVPHKEGGETPTHLSGSPGGPRVSCALPGPPEAQYPAHLANKHRISDFGVVGHLPPGALRGDETLGFSLGPSQSVRPPSHPSLWKQNLPCHCTHR